MKTLHLSEDSTLEPCSAKPLFQTSKQELDKILIFQDADGATMSLKPLLQQAESQFVGQRRGKERRIVSMDPVEVVLGSGTNDCGDQCSMLGVEGI